MRGKMFTVASVALLSCRGVLGIEELEETKDGGAAADSGADAAADAKAPGDAGSDVVANACASSAECGKCCRDSNQLGNKELETAYKPCVCTAACAAPCGANFCDGGDAKDTPCIPCIDQTIENGGCPDAAAECAKSAACKAVLDCLEACP